MTALSNTEIDRVLFSSPYQRLRGNPLDTSDPVRFFQGLPPTITDIEEGWGVSRPILVNNRIFPFKDFADEFIGASAGSIFILRAETSDGKTTFLRQLAHALIDRALVLEWEDLSYHKPVFIQELQEN